METKAEPMNIDRRSIIRLAEGTVIHMRYDYRLCEEELDYIREYGEYRKRSTLQPPEKSLLNEIRLRTVRRCSGKPFEAYTSNAYLIDQNLDVYAEEIRAEQEDILSFFDSLFFALALPDYEVDICKAAFIESAKKQKRGTERGKKRRRA